jgi:hypothetical protein
MTQRLYNPLTGDLSRYGMGPEHQFFSTAQAAAAPPTAEQGETTYDRALRKLGVVAEGSREASNNVLGDLVDPTANSPRAPDGPAVTDPDALGQTRSAGLSLSPTNQTIGNVLGTVSGVTGLGTVGSIAGGLLDAYNTDQAIASSRGANADLSGVYGDLTLGEVLSGILSGMTSDAFGTSFSDRLGERDAAAQNAAAAAAYDATVDANAAQGDGLSDAGGYSGGSGTSDMGDNGQGGGDSHGGSSGAGAGGYTAAGGAIESKESNSLKFKKGAKSVKMADGGFVVPADVVSGLGDGSTKAGYKRLGIGSLIEGPGTGMSDDIPATINGRPEAKVADGEVYLKPDEVKRIGKGDHAAGLKRLYDLMDFVRESRHGTKEQAPPLALGEMA